ncbi:superoxide dismutase [Metabacillus litoralis]|uniref:superoxide dismutase n=1 Tax=Metabacillus TaxID=2675233 RepID=UPI000EF6143A|nr:superoxide dismutase [Metabacillus litoralis]MCM3410634.1 superoxide dismutase [Metabacillus litoralis]UHA58279.1 superoxide dismutase [Metabacillus litoralis]
MSEQYILSMQKWCEEILESYHHSYDELSRNHHKNTLENWKSELETFQAQLHKDEFLDNKDVYERADQLFTQFEAYFEAEGNEQESILRAHNEAGTVPIGGHTLPPLPYSYDALEPYIDREIMRLHHDKHHQSYVDGLNKAEKEMQKARQTNNFELIKHWEREAAFHGAGHYLHTIFWNVMSPNGGGMPSGMLMREINQTFGSFEKFKTHFSEAAKNVEAVGWTILVWAPRSRRLEILQAEKHQNLSQWDVIPLLTLDVWEHAYYLQYKNERKKYVENWWNVVNWREVERRFHEAQQLKWKPF